MASFSISAYFGTCVFQILGSGCARMHGNSRDTECCRFYLFSLFPADIHDCTCNAVAGSNRKGVSTVRLGHIIGWRDPKNYGNILQGAAQYRQDLDDICCALWWLLPIQFIP